MKDIVTHFDKDYGREAINPFDVLESHRYFCVWGGVPNQNEDDSLGWNICVELLRYDKFRGKDGNNDKSNFQLSDQNSQEQAHMDLVLEQTQFKQEVLNRINELREFKEKGKKRCEQVLEKIQKIKVKDENTEKFEQKLSQYKVSLEDMIKELNLKVEPVKKVKPDEIVELEPQDS